MATALVTGANRGIGLEICRQLLKLGHRVVLASRDRAKGENAARALASGALASGAQASGAVNSDALISVAQLDVSQPDSIQHAATEIRSSVGGIDILVNNAAVLLGENDEVLETSWETLRDTFTTNVLGAIAVAQAFVPGMLERGYGRVVNVSSTAGQLTSMGTYAPAYSMSKAALNAFTKQLAAATKGSGVLVNSACPGWVRTDMGGSSAPRSVEEGADTIVWLATLPANGPTGKFFNSLREIDW